MKIPQLKQIYVLHICIYIFIHTHIEPAQKCKSLEDKSQHFTMSS